MYSSKTLKSVISNVVLYMFSMYSSEMLKLVNFEAVELSSTGGNVAVTPSRKAVRKS